MSIGSTRVEFGQTVADFHSITAQRWSPAPGLTRRRRLWWWRCIWVSNPNPQPHSISHSFAPSLSVVVPRWSAGEWSRAGDRRGPSLAHRRRSNGGGGGFCVRRRGEAEEREGRESERERRVERERGVGPCLLAEKGLGLRSLIFLVLFLA